MKETFCSAHLFGDYVCAFKMVLYKLINHGHFLDRYGSYAKYPFQERLSFLHIVFSRQVKKISIQTVLPDL